MFKKIYVEITNTCNLKCSFCIQNERKVKNMSEDEFKIILQKLKGYTKYLYLHILGEPLMHPCINQFIDMASENYFVNITTNGYLIKNIQDNKNIRQLNISLHSFNEKYNKDINLYMENIFRVVEKLKKNTYISYRLWVDSKYKNKIITILEKKYKTQIEENKKLDENVFINFSDTFTWPDLNNSINNPKSKCYGLIDHLGVLVDGTIVPCCLDSKGIINLGNIYKNDFANVLKQERVLKMIEGFKNSKRCEELCKHCGFTVGQ